MNKNVKPAKKFNLNINGGLLGFGTSADTDWKIIVFVTFILGVAVGLLCIYTYIKIDRRGMFVLEDETPTENKTLDISLLKQTVSYYQSKALEFEKIKNSSTSSVDPSL